MGRPFIEFTQKEIDGTADHKTQKERDREDNQIQQLLDEINRAQDELIMQQLFDEINNHSSLR